MNNPPAGEEVTVEKWWPGSPCEEGGGALCEARRVDEARHAERADVLVLE